MLSSTGSPLQEDLFHFILRHVPSDFSVIKPCDDIFGSEREKRKDAERLMNEPVKRGPGRPKGSKNRKTLAREAAIAKAGFTVSKTSLRQHRKAPKSGD